MRKSLARSLLVVTLLNCGCSDEFRNEDYEVGPNGEPPRILDGLEFYKKEFVSDEKNYVLALGRIHAFMIANDFYPLYPSCFTDVLDIRVTADVEMHEKRFPCVALQAEKGAPIKAYLSVTVKDVMFNQLDHNNRLVYTVSMFGRDDLAKLFTSDVEPSLRDLYTNKSSTGSDVAP